MNNAYDEIPKYLKQKESNVSKAHKKSKHKHQYAECLIRYKFEWDEKLNADILKKLLCDCGKSMINETRL